MSIKEIKEDLISEAELLIYQMKAAHLNTDYETVNDKADTLTDICKNLSLSGMKRKDFTKNWIFKKCQTHLKTKVSIK